MLTVLYRTFRCSVRKTFEAAVQARLLYFLPKHIPQEAQRAIVFLLGTHQHANENHGILPTFTTGTSVG